MGLGGQIFYVAIYVVVYVDIQLTEIVDGLLQKENKQVGWGHYFKIGKIES